MTRSVVKLIGFFLICGLLAIGLHSLLGRGFTQINTSEMGAFNRAMQGRVNAQIVVSGSSRAYGHYDPSIIAGITGKQTFNLARNGSHTDVQLAVLKAYLKHNSKPEMVIQNIDMHSLVPTSQGDIFKPEQYIPYLGEPEIYNGLKRINPAVWKWKWIPLYGYLVEDVNFGWLEAVRGLLGRNPPEDHINGYLPSDQQWTGDFDRFKAKHPNGIGFNLESRGEAILTELIDVCKENGINLVLVYSPQYSEMLTLVTNRVEIFNRFQEIAGRAGIPFLDYTRESYCQDRAYFYNSQHLNRKGAERFSRDLAQRLVDSRLVQINHADGVR